MTYQHPLWKLMRTIFPEKNYEGNCPENGSIENAGARHGKAAQILFTADPELKAKVLARTKKHGITLKSLFIFCMEAYLQNKIQVSIIGHPDLPLSAAEKIIKTEEEILHNDAKRLVQGLRRSYVSRPPDIL